MSVIKDISSIFVNTNVIAENDRLRKENETLKRKDGFEDFGEFLLKIKPDKSLMDTPFCPKCLYPMNWKGNNADTRASCPDCSRFVELFIYNQKTNKINI